MGSCRTAVEPVNDSVHTRVSPSNLAGQVDVAPALGEQLAAPEAGKGGGEVDGGVLVVGVIAGRL